MPYNKKSHWQSFYEHLCLEVNPIHEFIIVLCWPKKGNNKQHVKEGSRVKGYVKLGSKEECMKHL